MGNLILLIFIAVFIAIWVWTGMLLEDAREIKENNKDNYSK